MNVEDLVTDLCDATKRVLLLGVDVGTMTATGSSRGFDLGCEKTRGHEGPHVAVLPPSFAFGDAAGKVYTWPNP